MHAVVLAYFILRGAEGLELRLIVVETRVLRHEVVVRLVLVVFPQPVVAAEGQEVVVYRVSDTLNKATKNRCMTSSGVW